MTPGRPIAVWLGRDGRWLTVLGTPGERYADLARFLRVRYADELVDVVCRSAPCSRCGKSFEPAGSSSPRCPSCRRHRDPAPPATTSDAGNGDASSLRPDVDTAAHGGEDLDDAASTNATCDGGSSSTPTNHNGESA